MLNWANHHFSSLPILRPDVANSKDHPIGRNDPARRRNRMKNISRNWKVNGASQYGGSYSERLRHSKSVAGRLQGAEEGDMLTLAVAPAARPRHRKFVPKRHGFPSLSSKVVVKIVDALHGKSFGTVSLRCSTPLSYIRTLLSSCGGGDSTSFVFLDPEDNDSVITTVDEGQVRVGMYCPKVKSGPASSLALLPPVVNVNNNKVDEMENGSDAKARSLGPFTEQDILRVVRFMDKDGDGGITFSELSKAFRVSRRTKAAAKVEAAGKRVLRRIKDLIKEWNLSVKDWFDLMDSCGEAESNGEISMMELRKGLRLLVRNKRKFTENEIVNLTRYMDPNADGDLTLEEVEAAIKKSNEEETPEQKEISDCNAVLYKLEEHMKKKGIRLTDLFANLDESGDQLLSPDELAEGFATIANPHLSSKRSKSKTSSVVVNQKEKGKRADASAGKPPSNVTVKVKILSDDESILHEHEILRLNSPPRSPGRKKKGPLKLEPKFLAITDDEISQFAEQLGKILTFPLTLDSLTDTMKKIPQMKSVLDHLQASWSKKKQDELEKIHEIEDGSVQVTDDELNKIVVFLDPNNDGEVDLEELVAAFRLVRRGRAGISRREKTLEDLKVSFNLFFSICRCCRS